MNAAITAMACLRAQEVDVDRRKKELFVSRNKEKVPEETWVSFDFSS
jgi:hypothetical protein